MDKLKIFKTVTALGLIATTSIVAYARDKYIITASGANLRSRPSLKADRTIVGVVTNGRKVEVLETKRIPGRGTWMRVRTGGREGWINHRLLAPVSSHSAKSSPRPRPAPSRPAKPSVPTPTPVAPPSKPSPGTRTPPSPAAPIDSSPQSQTKNNPSPAIPETSRPNFPVVDPAPVPSPAPITPDLQETNPAPQAPATSPGDNTGKDTQPAPQSEEPEKSEAPKQEEQAKPSDSKENKVKSETPQTEQAKPSAPQEESEQPSAPGEVQPPKPDAKEGQSLPVMKRPADADASAEDAPVPPTRPTSSETDDTQAKTSTPKPKPTEKAGSESGAADVAKIDDQRPASKDKPKAKQINKCIGRLDKLTSEDSEILKPFVRNGVIHSLWSGSKGTVFAVSSANPMTLQLRAVPPPAMAKLVAMKRNGFLPDSAIETAIRAALYNGLVPFSGTICLKNGQYSVRLVGTGMANGHEGELKLVPSKDNRAFTATGKLAGTPLKSETFTPAAR